MNFSRANDHNEPLTAATISFSNNIIVTADDSGLIKIWTENKQLIREILFPEPPNSLCFIDSRGDLMIGHGNNISLLRAATYLKNCLLIEEISDN